MAVEQRHAPALDRLEERREMRRDPGFGRLLIRVAERTGISRDHLAADGVQREIRQVRRPFAKHHRAVAALICRRGPPSGQ